MKKKAPFFKKARLREFNFLTILLLAVIIIIITTLLSSKTVQKVKDAKKSILAPTPFPTVNFDLPEIPNTEKVKISGVEVKNFYKGASNIGQIGDVLFVDKIKYNITYYPLDNAFLIVILRWPFADVRELAEKDFLETLEIDKNQACGLSVYITTPVYANPESAGKNWRLSFCE